MELYILTPLSVRYVCVFPWPLLQVAALLGQGHNDDDNSKAEVTLLLVSTVTMDAMNQRQGTLVRHTSEE